METINMVEKLWDLANLVTAFAVVQTLTLTYSMAKGELRISLEGRRNHWGAFATTIVFTIFYLTAIIWSGIKGSA